MTAGFLFSFFPNGCNNFRDKLCDHDMLILLPFESNDLVGLRGAERLPADDLKKPDGGFFLPEDDKATGGSRVLIPRDDSAV